jgi:hypothetical protein
VLVASMWGNEDDLFRVDATPVRLNGGRRAVGALSDVDDGGAGAVEGVRYAPGTDLREREFPEVLRVDDFARVQLAELIKSPAAPG